MSAGDYGHGEVRTHSGDIVDLDDYIIQTLEATTFIVVSKNGHDTTGVGSFAAPYLTIAKAFTVWTATRHTIYVLAGEYEEVALVWPNITGLNLVALGPVSVSNSDSAAQVLSISPTFTASSFGASISGPLNLAADTQIGLKIANAGMTKKMNVYLDGLTAEMDTSGNSITIAGTKSGQAIRVYGKNLDLEGLLGAAMNDAGSRLRFESCDFMGGVTTTGAVAAELSMRNCKILTGGLSAATQWRLSNVACVYATDADPTIYSQLVDAFES